MTDWEWGIRVTQGGPPQGDPPVVSHEWWGDEATAREWLMPRQGHCVLELVRRRPARPAGPVEPVPDEPPFISAGPDGI